MIYVYIYIYIYILYVYICIHVYIYTCITDFGLQKVYENGLKSVKMYIGRNNVTLEWTSQFLPGASDTTRFGFNVTVCKQGGPIEGVDQSSNSQGEVYIYMYTYICNTYICMYIYVYIWTYRRG
jgi:hypothetical protein